MAGVEVLHEVDVGVQGRVRPRISSVHPLDDVVGDLQELAQRRVVGKAVGRIGKV